ATRSRRPAPCSGTGRWAPSSWSRSPPGRARWRRPWREREARRSWAGATRAQRSQSSASRTRWTTSRPAAAPRSSCWRGRRCGAWRCSMTPEGERRPLIAGNWKLWGTKAQAAEYCERLRGLVPPDGERKAEIGVCPVFTALELCVQELRDLNVGVFAQNMHHEETGAYTGEVSGQMLSELGVTGAVLGHSERRQYNCETDRALQDKDPAALSAGLVPILCVGESEEEREREENQRKLRQQVREARERENTQRKRGTRAREAVERVASARRAAVVLASEPIWAIGTGKVATP